VRRCRGAAAAPILQNPQVSNNSPGEGFNDELAIPSSKVQVRITNSNYQKLAP
jgi:hypothetical protein